MSGEAHRWWRGVEEEVAELVVEVPAMLAVLADDAENIGGTTRHAKTT